VVLLLDLGELMRLRAESAGVDVETIA